MNGIAPALIGETKMLPGDDLELAKSRRDADDLRSPLRLLMLGTQGYLWVAMAALMKSQKPLYGW